MEIDNSNNRVLQLMRAFLSLQTHEECMEFFDDLCSMAEIRSFCQRVSIAKMLIEGHTYETIEAETGAASLTIARVKKVINSEDSELKKTLVLMGVVKDPRI
ncbi:YerC/YecD family TrpR-related protein [Cytobacillus firmus]|nr:YerC/YecD family TrpR-related protein [Cytobacillus firmus]